MRLIYNGKEIDLIECKSFCSRLKGFMFDKKIEKALLFDNCNSIHTFFMKSSIDVIMCNKDNVIIYYYRKLERNKIIFPKKGVKKVFETPSNYFNIEIGKKMTVK